MHVIRLGTLILLGGAMLSAGGAWVVSMIPGDRPDPPEKVAVVKPINVVPQEAKLPWSREVGEELAKPLNVSHAPMPWRRDVQRARRVELASAPMPWQNDSARPKKVDVATNGLPWKRVPTENLKAEIAPVTTPWVKTPDESKKSAVDRMPMPFVDGQWFEEVVK